MGDDDDDDDQLSAVCFVVFLGWWLTWGVNPLFIVVSESQSTSQTIRPGRRIRRNRTTKSEKKEAQIRISRPSKPGDHPSRTRDRPLTGGIDDQDHLALVILHPRSLPTWQIGLEVVKPFRLDVLGQVLVAEFVP